MDKHQRREICYKLLVEQAKLGKTITYGEMAVPLRVIAQGVQPYLNFVLDYCRGLGVPELPIIVVNQRTRRPSGPYNPRTIGPETVRVFAFDWTLVEPPPRSL